MLRYALIKSLIGSQRCTYKQSFDIIKRSYATGTITSIKIPNIAESITEATLSKLEVQEGEFVEQDGVLATLETGN